MSRHLFLALALPDDLVQDEADAVADEIVRLLNRQRMSSAAARAIIEGTDFDAAVAAVRPVSVSGIPGPQWLTPETLAQLRRSASSTEGQEPTNSSGER